MNKKFYILEKIFFEDENLKKLSLESKVLYAFLSDRMSLSEKNGWKDDDGENYIYFTMKDAMELLGVGTNKCVKIFDELEKKGLIKRKKQGFGRPNVIYVYELSKIKVRTFKKHSSRLLKNKSQDLSKTKYNNTNINNTDISYTESISSKEKINDAEEDIAKRKILYESLKNSLNIDILSSKFEKSKLLSLIDIIAEAVLSKKEYLFISGERVPQKSVEERLLSLDETHIEYVLDCMMENTSDVKNIKSYLLTMLYNAPTTIDMYYEMRVKRDLSA